MREVQSLLKQLGYRIGDPVGMFGRHTASALAAFRDGEQLAEDPAVGCRDLARLRKRAKDCPENDPTATTTWVVRGTVLDEVGGVPMPGEVVRLVAWTPAAVAAAPSADPTIPDVPFGSPGIGGQELGFEAGSGSPASSVTTDAAGRFEIHYRPSDFTTLGQPGVAFFLAVEDSPNWLSKVYFGAKPVRVVTLTKSHAVAGPESEYARLEKKLSPSTGLLNAYGVASYVALANDDVPRFAALAGYRTEVVAQFIIASRLVSSFSSVTHEALFGLLRAGMPMRLPHLTAQRNAKLVAALQRALRKNYISDISASFQIYADEITALRFSSLRLAKPPSADSEIGTWAEVLAHVEYATDSIGSMADSDVEDFLAAVQGYEGTEEGFWTEAIYPASGGTPLTWITSGTSVEVEREEWRDRLRWIVDLARLSGRNKALIAKIKNHADLGSLRALSLWKRTDWQAEISGSEVPGSFPGTTDEYIDALRSRLWERFRDQGIRGLDKSTEEGKVSHLGGASLIEFLQANPDFDLVHGDVETLLASASFSGYVDAGEARGDLRAAQRLLRLTGSIVLANTLADGGVTSAFHVAQYDRESFVETFAGGGVTAAELERVHSHAVQRNTAVQLVYAHTSPGFYAGEPAATGTTAPDVSGWSGSDLVTSIDQGLSYCSCAHCSSIYSPSAYYFDLLSYLDGLPAAGSATSGATSTALGLLLDDGTGSTPMRRPELRHLLLSCENSNTPMPYIDLVNEVLELHVRNEAGLSIATPDEFQVLQTTEASSAIRVTPQWTNSEVYSNVLADGSVAPWTPLLERERLEARLRLQARGFERDALIELLASRDGSAPQSESSKETLGLSTAMWSLLTTNTSSAGDDEVALWFGYVPVSDLVPDPKQPGGPHIDWRIALSWIPETLRRTGLEIPELHEALSSSFVRAGGSLEIDFDGGDECDITQADVVSAFNTNTAGRLRQLIALARAVDEPIWEVGLAVDSVSSSGVIDATFLVDFAHLLRVKRWLKLSLEESVSLVSDTIPNVARPIYGDEDRAGYYDLHFVEARGADADFGTLPAADIADYAMPLAAVLQVGVDEVRTLLDDGVATTGGSSLTIANLTSLHRWTLLAKSLGVPVVALERFALETADATPFSTASISRALSVLGFLYLWNEQEDSGFSIAEVDWLLKHGAESAETFEVGEDEIAAFWTGLQETLLAVREEHLPQLPDRDEAAFGIANDLLRRRFVTPDGATKAITLLHYLGQEQNAGEVVPLDGNTGSMVDHAGQTDAVDSVFLDQSPGFGVREVVGDTTEVVKLLVTPNRPAAGAPLYNIVSQYYAEYYRRAASYEAVMTAFEEEFGLTPDVAEAALALLPWSGAFSSVFDYLLAGGYPAEFGGFPTGTPGDEFLNASVASNSLLEALHLTLRKLGLSASRLELTGEEVARLMQLPSEEYWNSGAAWTPRLPDLTALPVDGSSNLDYDNWRSLLAFVGARDRWDADGGELLSFILEGPPGGGPTFAELFDWNSDDVSALAAAAGLAIDPDDLGSYPTSPVEHPLLLPGFWPRRLVGLANFDLAMRAVDKLHVTAAQALEYGEHENLTSANESLVRALQSQLSTEGFATFETPIQDELRERRRDALVEYLRSKWGYDSADEISARLLLDVQTNVCMLTTRTVLALSTIQTWMQHLLGEAYDPVLDSYDAASLTVSISPGKSEQWSGWMKWYRVWEANRKVFVHPENWLDPELRTESTPQFKELEQRLLGGDLTTADAEDAFETYLEDLVDLAGLQIVGLYEEDERVFEGGTRKVLYVVGRTPSEPRTYHWRKKVADGVWNPWQRIDADIEGDHVLPVVYQRQLYLFWPRWTVVPGVPRSNGGDGGTRKLHVSLAWSQLRRGRWTASAKSEVSGVVERSVPASFSYAREGISLDGPVVNEGDVDGHAAAKTVRLSAGVRGDLLDIHVERVVQASPRSGSYDPLCPPAVMRDAATQVSSAGRFVFDARRGAVVRWEKTLPNYADGLRALLPPETYNDAQSFVGPRYFVDEAMTSRGLEVFIPLAQPAPDENLTDEGAYPQSLSDLPGKLVPLLDQFPTTFTLTPPHQIRQFAGSYPFAIRDEQRQYLVHPLVDWPDYQPNGSLPGGGYEGGRFSTSEFFAGIPEEDGSNYLGFNPSPDFGLPVCDADDELGGSSFPPEDEDDLGAEVPGPFTDIALNESANYTGWDFLQYAAEAAGGVYRFESTHHPFLSGWLGDLRVGGLDALFTAENQMVSQSGAFSTYAPEETVAKPYPTDEVDFSPLGFWSEYHWELFFHAPLLIARRLMLAGRHREAQQWLRRIFDPTRGDSSQSAPQRFWRFQFLADLSSPPLAQLLMLSSVAPHDLTPEQADQLRVLKAQIQEFTQHPFEPHRIARFRPVAYKRRVVMTYIENLLQWGDRLFSLDTMESINEASGLYITAANLLGDRPVELPRKTPPTPIAWDDIVTSSATGWAVPVVDLENVIPSIEFGDAPAATEPSSPSLGLYFCVPFNKSLLNYWDTVAERLFNIRNCRNIAGIKRQLPIFQPPIDPALLVQAAAAGLSIESVMQAGGQGGTPKYRFQVILDRARSLAGEVSSLGSALLSALEKNDGEELSRIRQGQEVKLLELVSDLRTSQVSEAESSLEAMILSLQSAREREAHFSALIAEWDAIEPISDAVGEGSLSGGPADLERSQVSFTLEASIVRNVASAMRNVQGIVSAVPQVYAGTLSGASFGGAHLANILGSVAAGLSIGSDILSTKATIAGMKAGWDRRRVDWQFQVDQTKLQIKELTNQRTAAEIRFEMAKLELRNHEQQLEDANEISRFMERKFSNHALYGWMAGQLSNIYKQTYRMALDMARMAERAYRTELYGKNTYPSTDTAYIRANHFDAGKKGLVAGEKLALDLRRLEGAWLDRRVREFEVTKTISLNALDPAALIELRTSGSCTFNINELAYDEDFPGHYFRRIKSVSITIPAVVGPHQGVHASLRLLADRVRVSNSVGGAYEDGFSSGDLTSFDDRFVYRFDASQSIVTSHGREDTGLFNPDHNDPRYLPFEGAGAISQWQVDVPQENNHFDIATLPDVLLHIRYTARDGGDSLASAARTWALGSSPYYEAGGSPQPFPRVAFSLRHDFPGDWQSFLYPPEADTSQTIGFTLKDDLFPRRIASDELSVEVTELTVLLLLRPGHGLAVSGTETVVLDASSGTPQGQAPSGDNIEDTGSFRYLVSDGVYWSGTVPQLTHNAGGYASMLSFGVTIDPGSSPANGVGAWAFNLPSSSLASSLPTDALTSNGSASALVDDSGTNDRLNPEAIADIVILATYTLNHW